MYIVIVSINDAISMIQCIRAMNPGSMNLRCKKRNEKRCTKGGIHCAFGQFSFLDPLLVDRCIAIRTIYHILHSSIYAVNNDINHASLPSPSLQNDNRKEDSHVYGILSIDVKEHIDINNHHQHKHRHHLDAPIGSNPPTEPIGPRRPRNGTPLIGNLSRARIKLLLYYRSCTVQVQAGICRPLTRRGEREVARGCVYADYQQIEGKDLFAGPRISPCIRYYICVL